MINARKAGQKLVLTAAGVRHQLWTVVMHRYRSHMTTNLIYSLLAVSLTWIHAPKLLMHQIFAFEASEPPKVLCNHLKIR